MDRSQQFQVIRVLLVLVLLSLACSMPTAPQTQVAPKQVSVGYEKTQIALGIAQTSVAADKATLQAREAFSITQPPLPVLVTDTPIPPAPKPTDTLPPEPTQITPSITPTLEPTETPVDIEAKIRAANVLVYEDMAGNFDRHPLVRQAISEMNFSGGRVIEVGDALGKFKENLLNTVTWDLILVAAEYRSSVQGEFWKYVYDQVNRGAAVVIETWYLDKHYTDIQPLFGKCGIAYQKNWVRGYNYRLENYAVYWLQPDHPFFLSPQDPVTLANPNYLYWIPPMTEDAGDLIQLDATGDAVLLAGTQPGQKSSYGVLATCLNGTMIVQTFSSHDYKSSEVVKMWKNYMRYTLTNHFQQKK